MLRMRLTGWLVMMFLAAGLLLVLRNGLPLVTAQAPTQGATATPALSPTTDPRITGRLTAGNPVRGSITRDSFSNSWTFRGRVGDAIDIKITRVSGDLDPVVAIFSPQGTIIATSTPSVPGIEATIPALGLAFNGDYVIMARRAGDDEGRAGTTTGQYELLVTVRASETAENTVLVNGGTIQGRLSPALPTAVYRVNPVGGVALSLDLNNLQRIARIRVIAQSGNVILSQQGIAPLVVATRFPESEAGAYFVEVSTTALDNEPVTDFALTMFALSSATVKLPGALIPLRYGDQRQIATSGETRYFVGRAGDLVSLKLTPSSLPGSASVRIAGPQDAVLYQGSIGSGLDQSLALISSGVYEIDVRPTDATTPFLYDINLQRYGANGIVFGGYDFAVERGTLTAGKPASGRFPVAGVDGWWLDATAGEVASLTVTPGSPDSAPGVALLRPDGTLLQAQPAERLQGAVMQHVLLPQTGRYRVVVFDSGGQGGSAYTLRYEEVSGGALRAGEAAKGILSASSGYSLWTLDASAGSLINVRLTSFASGSWSPALIIADPAGQIIATSSDSQRADTELNLLGIPASSGGAYRVIVAGRQIGNLATYNLLANVQEPFRTAAAAPIPVNSTSAPVPRYAAAPPAGPVRVQIPSLINSSITADQLNSAQRRPITFGGTARGEVSPGTPLQVWEFAVPEGRTLALTATALDSTATPEIVLFNAAGRVVRRQYRTNQTNSATLTYQTPSSGAYRAVVRLGLNGGRYLLSLTNLPVTAGNLSVLDGSPLAYGQHMQGEFSQGSSDDRYYFIGSNNDVITVNLARLSGDLAPAVQLLTPDGAINARDDNADGQPTASIARYRLPVNGLYTLVVSRSSVASRSIGDYLLSLDVHLAIRLFARGGGIINANQTVTGLLTPDQKEDVWLFRGRSGERMTFSAVGGSNGVSPIPFGLRLQDSGGRTFAAQDTALTQDSVRLEDITLPYDGIYRIVVAGGTQTVGAYQLTWQPEPANPDSGILRYNQTINGLFTEKRNAETWVFSGTAGDVIGVALEFERGDSFVSGFQVRAENGLALATVADIGNGQGARIENLLLPFTGSYTIAIANPDANYKGAGVYALSLALQDSRARSMGTLLRYGQQAEGTIYPDDAADVWVFTAHAGDLVQIAAQAQDQFLTPQLELKNAFGERLASTQASNSKTVALRDFRVTANGVYTIHVSGASKTTGSYLLSMDYTAPPVAPTASLNYGDTKEGLIADDRPAQPFVFGGRQGDTVTIKVTREPGASLVSMLALYDQNGQSVALGATADAESTLINEYKLSRTGQYTVVVSRSLGTQGRSNGRFSINITGKPEPRPVRETLIYSKTVNSQLSNTTPSQRFTFAGKAGDVIEISARGTSGDLDPILRLENAAGTVLAANDDAAGLNALISAVVLPTDDTYSIVITRAGTKSASSSGNYEMLLNRLYQIKASDAPRNVIAYGQRVTGSVDGQVMERRYAFNGVRNEEVSITLIHQAEEAPPFLTIEDPAGTTLVSGQLLVGQTAINRFKLPVDGLYTVAVKNPQDAIKLGYNPYALTLTLASSPGGRVSGGPLILNDTFTGEIMAGQPAHFWLFDGKAGQRISINLLKLSGDLMPAAILFNPNGNSLSRFGVTSGQSFAMLDSLSLPTDGVYTLMVLPGETGRTGRYRLKVQELGVTSAPAATALLLPLNQTVSGALSPIQPQQQWTIRGQKGQRLSVRTQPSIGVFSPQISLIAPNRQIVAESVTDPLVKNSQILQSVLPLDGDYTVLVSLVPSASTGGGTYLLSADVNAVSPQALNAVPLAYGQAVRKTSQQGTTDFWSVNGAAGDVVSALVVVENGNAPGIVLQDGSGQTLLQTQPSTTSDTGFEGYVLPTAGRYVLTVPVNVTGNYTVLIQKRQNTLAQGFTSKNLIPARTLSASISDTDPTGFWVFEGKAGDVVQIDAARTGGDLRLDVALYGPTGYISGAIADQTSGKIKLGPVRLADGGTYTVVVTRWSGNLFKTDGLYTVQLSLPRDVSGSKGGTIALYGQVVSGGISNNNSDLWNFNGQAGDIIEVVTTRTDGTLIPSLKLVEAATAKDIANLQGIKEELRSGRIILLTTGRYSVVVGRVGNTAGGYKLSVNRLQTAVQSSLPRADGISYGEDRAGELTQTRPAQAWVFFGKLGDRVSVEALAASGSVFDPFIYLVGPDGAALAADDNGSGSSGGNGSNGGFNARLTGVLLPTDGFYGIVVSGSPLRQGDPLLGKFTVALKRDQPGTAYQGSLTVGASVNGSLLTEQPVQEWKFRAESAKTIAATVRSSAASFNTSVSLVTADGTLLARSSTARDGAISVEAPLPGPGWYAVLISANTPGAEGSYQLQVSYALALDGGGALIEGQTVTGTISDASFSNAWRLEAAAGKSLVIDLVRSSGDLDFELSLFAPDGTALPLPTSEANTGSAGSTAKQTINIKSLPASGTYQIVVSRARGAAGQTSGGYTLRASFR